MEFFRALIEQLPPHTDKASALKTLTDKTGLTLPPDSVEAHARTWLAELDEHDVDHAVLFASLPQEAKAVADAVSLGGGRFSGFTLVSPLSPGAETFVRASADQGLKGILLFPVLHGYSMADERVRPVLVAAREKKMAVVAHFGLLQVKLRDVLGLPKTYDLRHANPLDLAIRAHEYPEIPFIIPHFGCGLLRETLLVATHCPNVHIDTSSSNDWMKTQPGRPTLEDVLEQTLGVVGPRRVIFGTDSGIFPRGYRSDLKDRLLEALEAIGADESVVNQVMGGNACRLLGLKT